MTLADYKNHFYRLLDKIRQESTADLILLLGGSLLILGLFFSRAVISIGSGVLVLSFVWRVATNGLKSQIKPITVIGLALLGYLALTWFWTDPANTEAYWHELRIKAGWIAVLIGLSGARIPHLWLRFFGWELLLSAAIIAALSVGNYFMNYEELNELIKQSKPIPIANGFWHISFSYMLAFSIFMGYYLVRKERCGFSLLALVLTLINFASLHILTARTGLLAFYATVLLLLVRLMVIRGKWLQGAGALVFLAAVGVAAIAYIPSLNNRYHNTVNDLKDVLNGANANYKSGAMRVKAMQAAWLVFTEDPVLGSGIGDLKPEMVQAYDDLDAMLLPENQIMPHNQFLNFMVIGGTVALVLFLIFWLWPVLKPEEGMDRSLFITFAALSFLAMNVEALLERQIGTAFFSFFFLLLASPLVSKSYK